MDWPPDRKCKEPSCFFAALPWAHSGGCWQHCTNEERGMTADGKSLETTDSMAARAREHAKKGEVQ
jgi:hypothetical protein